ncbi:MAG: VOC family protein [Myxococcus sp.]|nr:VOC family protein [Myxococcus sp.]
MTTPTQTITPCLWFDGQAEEAAAFYCSVFENSRITSTSPGPNGKALVVVFELDGLRFQALNGGPQFKFTEAISMSITCQTQAELDERWQTLLSGGGQEGQCGWLKDRFGLSWQVVPAGLGRLMSNPDPVKAQKVMTALLAMKKLVIADLERAAQ